MKLHWKVRPRIARRLDVLVGTHKAMWRQLFRGRKWWATLNRDRVMSQF